MDKLNRRKINYLIMEKLYKLIDEHPDQLLMNFDIIDPTKDLFYEESIRTLEKLEAIEAKYKNVKKGE